MKKRVIIFAVLFLVALVGVSPVLAGPIPPSFVGLPASGESTLGSFFMPGFDLAVDWTVSTYLGGLTDMSNLGNGALGAGGFLYMYQIENITGAPNGPDIFTVTLPFGTGSILGAGFIAGDDLDSLSAFHSAHDIAGEFGDIGASAAGVPLTLQSSTATGFSSTVSVAGGNVSWLFENGSGVRQELLPGHETDTLFLVSTLPPAYGIGGAQDGSLPSPWNSLAVTGQKVPVPTPEPSTLLSLGIGIAMFGALSLRRFQPKL